MALTVTGIDPATGRVTPKGTNVIIPPGSAGIGDVVFCLSGADPQVASNLRVIGWGTTSKANVTINGSTYVPYGVIYGFVNGMAMVAALEERSLRWAISGSSENPTESGSSEPSVSRTTAITTGGRMRNGNVHTYAGMNLNSLLQNSYTGADTILHPSGAWDATAVMSKANFDALTPSASNAKGLYGTYENYVRQVMAVNGTPGTVFGFHDTGIKVHEQGKYNTLQLGIYGPGSGTYASSYPGSQDDGKWYPAANYCYNYAVSGVSESGKHNWWLPSMFELAVLMTDTHRDKVNTCGVTTLSNRVTRWSSIRTPATYAWNCYSNGFSYASYCRYAFTTRAVTLLKLV